MALTAADRLRRKRFNKRLELGINYVHAAGLAVLGFGVVRFIFGDADMRVAPILVAALISLAIEALAIYLYRYLQSEEDT